MASEPIKLDPDTLHYVIQDLRNRAKVARQTGGLLNQQFSDAAAIVIDSIASAYEKGDL